jgi:hypothetical protein
VHETFIQTPEFREFRSLAGWQTRRTQLLDVLGQRIFQDLPKGLGPVAFQVEPHKEGQYFDNLTFESEPGVEIRALIRTPGKQEHRLPALLYVASDGEDPEAIRHMLSTPRGQDGAVRMVVYPRGVGEVPWEKSFWKAVLRNAMHVGHTVDSLRLWDVLRAIQLLQGVDVVDAGRITVMGSGISAGLALYASILDSSVHQALLMNPPESHVEGPIFLNILRHTDLPEAAALLAPRRLNFYSRMPAAFSPVKSVYALYGHPEHVHVTMDMQAVVEGRYDHDFASGQ